MIGPGDLTRLEEIAAPQLDPVRAAYVAASAGDSAAANEAAWQRWRLRPRVLRDVSNVDTTAVVLGESRSLPLLIAPTAMHGLACADGETATARAATAEGVTYVVAATATASIEDIGAAAPGGSRWMQAYVMRDRGRTRAMLERAAASGCEAVVVTVDSPGIPYVPRGQLRPLNDGLPLPNLCPEENDVDVLAVASDYASDLTFDDLSDIRSWTGLPLVVKGVLRGEDAERCLGEGADAVAVSNHGGRQVAGAVSTADALPDVVAAVDGRAEVFVDGGIRTGPDILRALALGATAVMVGRPVWWGLAIDGESGARSVLAALREDLERTMALCGLPDLAAVEPDLISANQS